ncbi:TolC family protein [Parvularcula lutaonensis]|uniref:TolC family protein n=1 Tax=Parvularcula lutaonensis TaxID=491923 RepID=A0ABV7MDM8_9PROT|nr:TolC family protein [Parvularcula lutaonensis]GGY48839.1 hypothetical protein GCM10007148_16670 [Parvularcula lutaonensis]
MGSQFFATLLSIVIAISSAAGAQSFEELERLLDEHPSLTALAYQQEAARERSIAASALPDPQVSFGVNNLPVSDPAFNRFLPTNKAIGVRQELPNLAGRRARRAQAEAAASLTAAMRAARYDALKAELVALLHEKARIKVARQAAEAQRTAYAELAEIIDGEIRGGRPSVYRLAEIDAEQAEVASNLAALSAQEAEADARLIDLLGFVPDTPAPSVAIFPWQDDPASFHAVALAAADIAHSESSVAEARAAFRPNWGAQVTYQQREEGSGAAGAQFAGDDWVSGMVTVSVPLWAGKSQKPKLRAAKAEEAAARSHYLAAVRSARAQYAAFSAQHRTAIEQQAILTEKVSAIEDEIASQLRLYESGRGTYAPVLEGEIAILTLRARIARQKASAATAAARMNSLLVSP